MAVPQSLVLTYVEELKRASDLLPALSKRRAFFILPSLRAVTSHATLNNMYKTMRRYLAIFLMLWLPIFSGSALAMMSCPHMMSHDMSSMSMSDQADHRNHDPAPADKNLNCDQCGLCQIACSPGLTATLSPAVSDMTSVENATRLRLFRSIVLPLLDPPPLVLI